MSWSPVGLLGHARDRPWRRGLVTRTGRARLFPARRRVLYSRTPDSRKSPPFGTGAACVGVTSAIGKSSRSAAGSQGKVADRDRRLAQPGGLPFGWPGLCDTEAIEAAGLGMGQVDARRPPSESEAAAEASTQTGYDRLKRAFATKCA